MLQGRIFPERLSKLIPLGIKQFMEPNALEESIQKVGWRRFHWQSMTRRGGRSAGRDTFCI